MTKLCLGLSDCAGGEFYGCFGVPKDGTKMEGSYVEAETYNYVVSIYEYDIYRKFHK